MSNFVLIKIAINHINRLKLKLLLTDTLINDIREQLEIDLYKI